MNKPGFWGEGTMEVIKNVNMTKAGNLGVFVCVCEVDRHCVCDMLMLVLGACLTTFVFMCKLKSEYL